MKSEYTTILLAAFAAPGFWEVIKSLISSLKAMITGHPKVSIAEIDTKLDSQGKKIDSLEQSFMQKTAADDEREAKAARRRILRADDEIRVGMKHSKDFFEDVLRDIDFYEEYCDNHTHFKNKCAESAIGNVVACYEDCKRKNSFL